MKPGPMNTSTILLVATALTLVVTFGLSIGELKKTSSSPQAKTEAQEIALEIERLKAETAALRAVNAERYSFSPSQPVPAQPAPLPPSSSTPDEPTTQPTEEVTDKDMEEIARLREELGRKDEALEKAEKKVEVAEEEAEWALGDRMKDEKRRTRNEKAIRNALTLGSVTGYNGDYGFLTFRPSSSRQFSAGEKLAVRRHSGILCRATVDRLADGEVLANVTPISFGGEGLPEVQPGDEIILMPEYYDAPKLDSPALEGGSSGQGIQDIPLE